MTKQKLRELLKEHSITSVLDALASLAKDRAHTLKDQKLDNWEKRCVRLYSLMEEIDYASVGSNELYSADNHLQ